MSATTQLASFPWRWMSSGEGPADENGWNTPGVVNWETWDNQHYYNQPELVAANGEVVISGGGGEYTPIKGENKTQMVAHALYVERAVNCHAELLEALRNCEEALTDLAVIAKAAGYDGNYKQCAIARDKARATIAKARGGAS